MEKQKPKEKKVNGGGPQGLGDIFSQFQSAQGGVVSVLSGPYAEQLPIDGMSIEQVRSKFKSQFDIDPESIAIVDGQEIDKHNEHFILKAGMTLMFTKKAGEKGVVLTVDGKKKDINGPAVVISDTEVKTISPEGIVNTVPLSEWLDKVAAPVVTTGNFILSDGIKSIVSRGTSVDYTSILTFQIPPNIWQFQYKPLKGKQRTIELSLPYVLVVVVYQAVDDHIKLMKNCECFFLKHPLRSLLDKDICYPAMCNTVKVKGKDEPLSWIATDTIDWLELDKITNRNDYIRAALRDVVRNLLETSFCELKPKDIGGTSFLDETIEAKKIVSLNDWEKESKKNPMYGMNVDWLETGFSLKQIVTRIFDNMGVKDHKNMTVQEIERAILKNKKGQKISA